MQCGAVGHAQACGAVEVDSVWNLDEPRHRRGDALARGTMTDITEYAVACLERVHVRPNALDHAGEFCRWRERQWRLDLIFTGYDQRVEKVKRSGFDPYHSLAGAGDGIGDVAHLKIVGCAETGAEQGFHGVIKSLCGNIA